MIFPTLASAPPLSASCRSTRSCHSLRLMRYPTRAEFLVLHRAMLEQSGGRRAFAIWVPGTLRWPSRAAMETFLKVHGLRLSPPRGYQRLERHATRLVALGARIVLPYT